ncbi:MAG: peptidase MA family metallohydrolase [Thermomicrobiales bacterium]
MATIPTHNRGAVISLSGWKHGTFSRFLLTIVPLVLFVVMQSALAAQTSLPDSPSDHVVQQLPAPPFVAEPRPVYPSTPPSETLPAPPAGPEGPFRLAQSTSFAFFVQSGATSDAATVAASLGPVLDTAYDELSVLFDIEFRLPIGIYVYASDSTYVDATRGLEPATTGQLGITPDAAAARLHVLLSPLAGRSPLERENGLRHATALVLLGQASAGNLPRGFAEGMASYVERPVMPRLARIAAVTNGAFQAGDLLSWSDLNRRRPVRADSELVAAESYAMVAFLVDRYGLRSFRGMLAELRENPDWRVAMRNAYNRGSNEVEAQWRDNLPRWAASEWRDNLVAAFDLARPRASLDAGDYAGAKTLLEQSWRLFRDLDDQERLTLTEAMLSQADIGIQAETAMAQAREALELHTYDRAQALLEQARAQYDQLPAEQRPDTILETYETLAGSGLTALTSLNEANRRKTRWSEYAAAREAALDAGTRFAALGDEEMRADASSILEELDTRQRRLVLLLGALAAITAAWLALWLWTRGPPALNWR